MEIDLQAIAGKPASLKGRDGRTYLVDPEMSAAEALFFMDPELVKALSGAELVQKMAAIVSRGLIGKQPNMTPEAVLERFSLTDLGHVVARFLGLSGLTASLLQTAVQGRPVRTTKTSARRR